MKMDDEEKKRKSREASARWRREHPEYRKEWLSRRTEETKSRDKENKKRWDAAHPPSEETRIKHRESEKKRYEADPEKARSKCRERMKRWYSKNSPKVISGNQKYREDNRDKNQAYYRKYYQKRSETDPAYRILLNLRSRVYIAVKKDSTTRSSATLSLIGCTVQELRAYLEEQFQPGMTWENYGPRGWHIDHIIPCAAFDLTDPAQQRACFHCSNLQPLWAVDNLRKGARLPESCLRRTF